jgi:hypothetical protein
VGSISFNSLLIHTVGVSKRTTGSTDRYGDEVVTYAAPVSTAARVEQVTGQSASVEILRGRDTRLTWFRVFLPAGTDVAGLDRIIWGTRTLEVDGEPATLYNSVGAHHVTAIGKEIKD